MIRAIVFGLLLCGSMHAEQLTVLVSMEAITDVNEDTGITNTFVRYTFSAPQAIGQLQGAVVYRAFPTAAFLSNDIAAATMLLLTPLGKTNQTIRVLLP